VRWRGAADRFAASTVSGEYEDPRLGEVVGALRRAAVETPPTVVEPDFRRLLRQQLTAVPVRGPRHRIALVAAVVVLAVVGTSVVTIERDSAAALVLQQQAEAAELALTPLAPAAAGQLHLRLANTSLRALQARAVRGGVDRAALANGLAGVDDATKQAARILSVAALGRGDRAPLDALDTFVDGQLAELGALNQALSGGRTQALDRSESLVHRLAVRSRQLRVSVACAYGYAGPSGDDDLGARPPACRESIE
jgi:hypothetical protein